VFGILNRAQRFPCILSMEMPTPLISRHTRTLVDPSPEASLPERGESRLFSILSRIPDLMGERNNGRQMRKKVYP
jgi:hypothetical protein